MINSCPLGWLGTLTRTELGVGRQPHTQGSEALTEAGGNEARLAFLTLGQGNS